MLDLHSAEYCYLLVIFHLCGKEVLRESAVLFAGAWKLQIIRNIYIFLAIELFFMIFWLGAHLGHKQYLFPLYF